MSIHEEVHNDAEGALHDDFADTAYQVHVPVIHAIDSLMFAGLLHLRTLQYYLRTPT